MSDQNVPLWPADGPSLHSYREVQGGAAPLHSNVDPLPGNIKSTQPGGGICYQIELAWGVARRWYLKTVRPDYVQHMAALRQGDTSGAPHEIIDPRDLKYCRNQCTAHWPIVHDLYRWRSHLGFARWGLCELILMAVPLLLLTWGMYSFLTWAFGDYALFFNWLALAPLVVCGLIVWFFRDPSRVVPSEAGLVVAPADGKIVEITPLAEHEFIGEPAVKIGIFLSIFNVHINRAPLESRVLRLHYSPGKFLNALDPESAILNESMWIGLESRTGSVTRKAVVRQISGLIARRIVCDLTPGQIVSRGEKFGMIKLGSRTELILPTAGFELLIKPGQAIKAGSTVIGRYVN